MTEMITRIDGTIATIVLNRPEKRNALNDALIAALTAAFEELNANTALSAIVLRGEGNDFCSGADLSALQKIGESDILENLADAEQLMRLISLIRRVRIPVIAAVTGRALAGGCGLATACDVVLASRSARFGYPEVRIGFVPAMVMAILRRNISEKRAFEMITRGFEFSADEAERVGLINHVFDEEVFEEEVAAFVSSYARTSRSAVMLTKKLLYQMDGMTFDAALETGAEVNAIARLTADCKTGIAKFLERKP
ncbi:MAG: enoyl-CoA hydratase/isomerase family protein [Acidobacteria bacterium]|nr:enoyl-CoA hydratase/isomerase family protein [Acidobacteriota bacterium]MBK8811046.1 enoyl-CoA hydratase/isomerase family protein [Acidobacteriota bacterium]